VRNISGALFPSRTHRRKSWMYKIASCVMSASITSLVHSSAVTLVPIVQYSVEAEKMGWLIVWLFLS
jgi:hypothetical protein